MRDEEEAWLEEKKMTIIVIEGVEKPVLVIKRAGFLI